MKREMVVGVSLCCLMFCSHSLEAKETVYWPTFRGPVNTGVAPDADPPVTWSESENIKWKVELPGKGSSSPIIWEDKIIFQTAISTQTPQEEKSAHKFDVVCLDRKSGKLLWQKTVKEELPHEGHHRDGSFASYSRLPMANLSGPVLVHGVCIALIWMAISNGARI